MRSTYLEQSRVIPFLDNFCPELKVLNKIKFKSSSEKIELASISIASSFIEHLKKNDAYGAHYLAMASCFFNSEKKVYKIAEEFGKELYKVDLKLDEKYLQPNTHPILIEFPDSLEFQDSEEPGIYYKTALVMLRNIDKEATLALGNFFEVKSIMEDIPQKQLSICFPQYSKDGSLIRGGLDAMVNFVNIGHGCDLKQSILDALVQQNGTDYDLVKYAINTMIYINSGNPDLREYKAPKKPVNFKGRDRKWLRQNKKDGLNDVTLVGFSYKKSAIFGMEKTTVSGHFRWQPYGEGLSSVKLIWIESHERIFKNFKETKPVEAQPQK